MTPRPQSPPPTAADPGPTATVDPPVPSPPPTQPPPQPTEIEELLDQGGLTDEDIGFDRQPVGSAEYGLDTATLNLCEAVDETDAQRVERVQHWWESPGWATGEDPAVAISAELVVYEPGGAEAAFAAFASTLADCPERTLEDGSTIAFAGADPPPGALPDSLALRGVVTTPEGIELEQVIVVQHVGELVGYLYVTGLGETATTEAARVAEILASRLPALQPQVAPG